MIETYRGYTLSPSLTDRTRISIYSGNQLVTREDSLPLAKARVDWYVDGSVR